MEHWVKSHNIPLEKVNLLALSLALNSEYHNASWDRLKEKKKKKNPDTLLGEAPWWRFVFLGLSSPQWSSGSTEMLLVHEQTLIVEAACKQSALRILQMAQDSTGCKREIYSICLQLWENFNLRHDVFAAEPTGCSGGEIKIEVIKMDSLGTQSCAHGFFNRDLLLKLKGWRSLMIAHGESQPFIVKCSLSCRVDLKNQQTCLVRQCKNICNNVVIAKVCPTLNYQAVESPAFIIHSPCGPWCSETTLLSAVRIMRRWRIACKWR